MIRISPYVTQRQCRALTMTATSDIPNRGKSGVAIYISAIAWRIGTALVAELERMHPRLLIDRHNLATPHEAK